jgi:hypothetical protein
MPPSDALLRLSTALERVEEFYDSIGGVVGYQLQCLRLLPSQQHGGAAPSGSGSSSSSTGAAAEALGSASPAAKGAQIDFLVPAGLDLSHPGSAAAARAATAAGLAALPDMAEIYPLGGAGDRLGLCDEATGESLPTAVLQVGGVWGSPGVRSALCDVGGRGSGGGRVGGWMASPSTLCISSVSAVARRT